MSRNLDQSLCCFVKEVMHLLATIMFDCIKSRALSVTLTTRIHLCRDLFILSDNLQ